MGLLTKIGAFLGGGAAKAGLNIAGGIADIVERWNPGDSKNVQFTKELTSVVNASYDSARRHDAPMQSGVRWLDGVVNGVNRLIRPWVTITVIGSLFGYWNLPPTQNVAPEYWVMVQIVLGFWFGGRLVTKDIPAALGYLRK